MFNREKKFRRVANSDFRKLLIQNGRILSELCSGKPLKSLQDVEFKVFSQFGEDGIIQFLINNVELKESEHCFVEIGVEDYKESNTRFLLENNNWSGYAIDIDKKHMNWINNDQIFWRNEIYAIQLQVNRLNINSFFSTIKFKDLGLLSIDIDGMDYWIWKSLEVVKPIILIIEWNSLFGKTLPVVVPYDENFRRSEAHYSNNYWGASWTSLINLGIEKGYKFIGSNSAGNNLFFVRSDRLADRIFNSIDTPFIYSRFRESRSENDVLTGLDYFQRRELIENLPVTNTVTNKTDLLANYLLEVNDY